MLEMASLRDRLGRPPGVLRLSLTARCNLACPYCCPDSEDPPELLTLAERVQLVGVATELGFRLLRLTGGEPLLHQGLEELVAALEPLRGGQSSPGLPGLREIALTTNGVLLSAERARDLRAAGLDRITVSLDGTDGASVARMAGLAAGAAAGAALLEKVLAALEHARAAGFDPARGALKLNAVIARGRNEDQLLPLAELARQRGIELRLIEFMDVGNRNGWQPDLVLPAAEMVRRIGARWPLVPLGRQAHGTASRWRYRDGGGHLAVVASISAPFCGDCDRLRVTADGVAFTCLFASSGLDLKPWLRSPAAAGETLSGAMGSLWSHRHDRYSEERAEEPASGTVTTQRSHAEMAYLGG
ncbi:radical SAM protein [Synechococcus sp. Tobar12-5m-g]|uniref:GTP 3',8-cyclase MoaA n=1 Tax=unclassified Synechococcus TaxID=2626047 RepID=UPI0020CF6800|nr:MULTISPECIES: radical SAM protein [unclassified Synechococcus]MCP9773284.1 radical SAM protein [Synechococcus sp. Tobar12-5m-g]MCP9874315.1 radical SAM protein [Synechococcus sp. Cruz CV-v-12]